MATWFMRGALAVAFVAVAYWWLRPMNRDLRAARQRSVDPIDPIDWVPIHTMRAVPLAVIAGMMFSTPALSDVGRGALFGLFISLFTALPIAVNLWITGKAAGLFGPRSETASGAPR